MSEELKQFRCINGGLFAAMLPTAEFDAKMRQTLINCVSFDWSRISPAVFGAMFQGVMNKNRRRESGARYTGEGNFLKLINPLFMDELPFVRASGCGSTSMKQSEMNLISP